MHIRESTHPNIAGGICSLWLHSTGAWLSLVEHLNGVQGVGSSNLPAPTTFCSLDDARDVRWSVMVIPAES